MVLVPITTASTPVSAAGGCLDKLEIETPAETATAFGAVILAPGETFSTNIKHWTSRPTAATYLNSFNSEIRLSPMLDDGFPGYASTTQRDAFAADGPWQSDGFMNDGTFTYTNPSTSSVTSFVLEVSYWNRPASGIIGRTEASGFSTCVSPHTPPDRPTRDCVAAPTLVANGANVWSEPFEMKKDAYISMRMVDERPLRYDDNGDQQPLLRSDYLIRTWLYGRSGPDDTWHYIRRDAHASQNNWLRGSYVGSWDISMKNSSNYTEVMVIFGKWISRGYALSTPLDVSIKDPGQSWRSVCLTSTQTTVTWDTAPSCAADQTARMQAQVTNKSGESTGYRISLIDPATADQVHGSHFHTIANGATGTVALGGIPTGTWDLRVYELQPDGTEALVGSRISKSFDATDCDAPEPEPECAAAPSTELSAPIQVFSDDSNPIFESPLEPFNPLDCSDLVALVHHDQLLVATHEAGGYYKVQSGWIRIDDTESAEHLNYYDRMNRAFDALPNKPELEDVLARMVAFNAQPPISTDHYDKFLTHENVAYLLFDLNSQAELTSVEKMYVWSKFGAYKVKFGASGFTDGTPVSGVGTYFVSQFGAHPDVVNDDILGPKNTSNHTVLGWTDGFHGGGYAIQPTMEDAAQAILEYESTIKNCLFNIDCINWGDVESSTRTVFLLRQYMEELDFHQYSRVWGGLMLDVTPCPARLLSKDFVLDTSCASSIQ